MILFRLPVRISVLRRSDSNKFFNFIHLGISLWEQLLEDLIEFLEYEEDRKTRTWPDITHFMILQVKVKGLFDKLLEEYAIEENELAGYAPYFLHFTKEYLDTFDSQVKSFTKAKIQNSKIIISQNEKIFMSKK